MDIEQLKRDLQNLKSKNILNLEPTIADLISTIEYWQRKYEQEKILWQEKYNTLEEHLKTNSKLVDEKNLLIKELQLKIEELTRKINQERELQEEKEKMKEREVEFYLKTREEELKKLAYHSPEFEAIKNELFDEKEKNKKLTLRIKEVENLLETKENENSFLQQKFKNIENSLRAHIEELQLNLSDLQKKYNYQLKNQDVFLDKKKQVEILFENFVRSILEYITQIDKDTEVIISSKKIKKEPLQKLQNLKLEISSILDKLLEFLGIIKIELKSEEKVSVTKLINDVVENFQKENEKINVTNNIQTEYEKSIDVSLFKDTIKILFEILKNRMPSGGEFTIDIVQNDFLKILFKDTGENLKEDLSLVFNPFYSKKIDGMKLFKIKKILELHNMDIEITDITNGVCFSIILNPDANSR